MRGLGESFESAGPTVAALWRKLTMDKHPDSAPQLTAKVWRSLGFWWPLVFAGALLIVVQLPLLKEWWKVWNEPYSYFSHGPLVPLIAGYMVWANRQRLAQYELRPSWIGFLILAVAVVLFAVGNWIVSASIRALVFVLMIFGTLLSLMGTRATRLLSVPVFFLLTMIPIAPSLLDSATGKLQVQSAAVAAKFLQWTGYEANLQGATIYSGGLPEPLIVGIPCSGLRTLISLITFTVFFVYMVRAEWWKKALLLAASFPLSIFINSLRITMIGYAGFWTGSAEAMHKFHDYSGYIGLAICFAMLFGLAKLIRANTFGLPVPEETPEQTGAVRRGPVGGFGAVLGVAVLLGIAGLVNVYGSPLSPRTKGKIDRENIPKSFGSWSYRELPIDKLTREWLKAGDLMNRAYTDFSDDGREVQVFITAARDPDAFHDPHRCLQGGGTPISKDKIIKLHFDRPRPITVTATLLETKSDYESGLVIYFYMMGPDSMPGTRDVWARNRANLVHDLVWLLLHPTRAGELRSRIESRQFVWYRFSTTVLSDPDTDLAALKKFIAEFVAHRKGFGE